MPKEFDLDDLCFKSMIRKAMDLDLENGELALNVIEAAEKKAAGEHIGMSRECILEYGRSCGQLFDLILFSAGSDAWLKEYRRRYPEGCIIARLASGLDAIELERITSAANDNVSYLFRQDCSDIYDYFTERGKCSISVSIGDNGEILTAYMETDKLRDACGQFSSVFAMLACYGGNITIICSDAKELYMYGGSNSRIYPESPEDIDYLIQKKQGVLRDFTGKAYMPQHGYRS